MELSFDQLPNAVSRLYAKIEDIERLRLQKNEPQQQIEHWFDFNELREYLPEKPAPPTLYQKLANREIPGHKRGKKWYFLKSEIDIYLKTGRKKTLTEIESEADTYLQSKKKRG